MFHCLTFRVREKKSEASKGAATAAMADASEIGREAKLVKIQSFNQPSKPLPVRPTHGQADKPKRSHSINKKVEDFIARTKMKITRSITGVAAGSHPST